MCGTVLCVAAVALGIDVGWQPLPDGGMEYVIQLEPQTVELLRSRPDVQIPSDIPAYLKDLRRLRITVGNAALARKMPAEVVSGPAFPTSLRGPLPRPSLEQRASHLFLDVAFPAVPSRRRPAVRRTDRSPAADGERGTRNGGRGTGDGVASEARRRKASRGAAAGLLDADRRCPDRGGGGGNLPGLDRLGVSYPLSPAAGAAHPMTQGLS